MKNTGLGRRCLLGWGITLFESGGTVLREMARVRVPRIRRMMRARSFIE
jgi:hypothetical protein